MATLPAATYISDDARTQGEVKVALEDMRSVIEQNPGGRAESELTIASGSVTATRAAHTIDTEADATSDDLANILQTNLPEGSAIFIRASEATRVVTLKHAAGGAGQLNLLGSVDLNLNSVAGHVLFIRVGTAWREVVRGVNPPSAYAASFVDAQVSPVTVTMTAGGSLTFAVGGSITAVGNNSTKTMMISDAAHTSRTDNPHSVTHAQVGSATAQWNANQIQGTPVHTAGPSDTQVLTYNSGNSRAEWMPSAAQPLVLLQFVSPSIGANEAIVFVASDSSGGITGNVYRRVLNTEVLDASNLCTLAANKFKLALGTYRIRGTYKGWYYNGSRTPIEAWLRLRNETAAATVHYADAEEYICIPSSAEGSQSDKTHKFIFNLFGQFVVTDANHEYSIQWKTSSIYGNLQPGNEASALALRSGVVWNTTEIIKVA